ncbi:MAG: hypothetical protein EOO09_12190 [Chitinophagaceae bacterium]|nr:MAG: hypothetical protein EOO09_12190 [Chitinophagaceae bacterium]
MKKILLLGIVATLFTLGASAQSRKDEYRKDYKKDGYNKEQRKTDRHHMGGRDDRHDYRTHSLNRGERMKMRHNASEFQRAKHRAYRDGRLSKREARKLNEMKKDNRRDAFRYKHNNR